MSIPPNFLTMIGQLLAQLTGANERRPWDERIPGMPMNGPTHMGMPVVQNMPNPDMMNTGPVSDSGNPVSSQGGMRQYIMERFGINSWDEYKKFVNSKAGRQFIESLASAGRRKQ